MTSHHIADITDNLEVYSAKQDLTQTSFNDIQKIKDIAKNQRELKILCTTR